MTAVGTYEELAESQKRDAQEADLKLIAKQEEIIQREKHKLESSICRVAQAIWMQGTALRRICQHEQVTFAFIDGLKSKLPWGKDTRTAFEIARRRVSVAARLEGGEATWTDVALDARRAVLQQAELLQINERGEAFPSETRNVYNTVLVRFGICKFEWQKAMAVRPLEQRADAEIRDFLSDTEWIAEERERAEKILSEK